MFLVMKSEWYKLRKSKVIWLILVVPFIVFLIGLLDLQYLEGMNRWYSKLITINISYGILFLPLITGVFASIICRYEHQDGGWKQLLAMPVTRGQVYLSKYLVLITIILIMQLLYLCSFYLMGLISGITEPFPISIVWAACLGGCFATFLIISLIS